MRAWLRSDEGGPFLPVVAQLLAAGVVFNEITVSPTHADDGTLFGAYGRDVFRSVDRGETWEHVGPNPVRYENPTWRFVYRDVDPMLGVDPAASTGTMTRLLGGGSVDVEFSGTGASWHGGPGIGRALVFILQ